MVASTLDPERMAFTPTELAAALGCSRQFIQNLIRSGELPSAKLGRKRLISRAIVENLLEGGGDRAPAA